MNVFLCTTDFSTHINTHKLLAFLLLRDYMRRRIKKYYFSTMIRILCEFIEGADKIAFLNSLESMAFESSVCQYSVPPALLGIWWCLKAFLLLQLLIRLFLRTHTHWHLTPIRFHFILEATSEFVDCGNI